MDLFGNVCGKLRATNFLRQTKTAPIRVLFLFGIERAVPRGGCREGRDADRCRGQEEGGGQRLPQHEKYRASNGLRRIFRKLQRGKIPFSVQIAPVRRYFAEKIELKKKNIVRIKNRSIQTSESSPLISADYGKSAFNNNISQKGQKSQGNNNKNSIRTDEVNLQAENGGVYGDVLADGEGVTKRLEALIKEKRQGTLGLGVANEQDVDAADRMREAVQRDIERYCEEHEITESERQWAEMAADIESVILERPAEDRFETVQGLVQLYRQLGAQKTALGYADLPNKAKKYVDRARSIFIRTLHPAQRVV